MAKNKKEEKREDKHRNSIALAMVLRHRGGTVIKDRRTPRGGARNKKREFLSESEEGLDMKREVARKQYEEACEKFAELWGGDSPEDSEPDEIAMDAASGFFHEYPQWETWAKALGKTRSQIQSAVADLVYDAMVKSREES